MDTPGFPSIATITQRDLLTISADATVRAATDAMREHNVSSVVFFSDEKPHIFSIEQFLSLAHDECNFDQKMVELDIPSATVICEDQTVLEALDEMETVGTRYLVIANMQDEIIGIVTYTDLMNAIDPIFLAERRTIGDIIRKKETPTFSADWILQDVLCHLRHTEDSIIVVDGNQLLGIITSKDVFRTLLGGQSTERPLSEYMTHPVITISYQASISEALSTLKTHKIKRAVAVDENGMLVGVITQRELIGQAFGYWARLLRGHSEDFQNLVSALTSQVERYRSDSLTDTLTGLGNRRRFNTRIRQEIERVRRYGNESFCFLLIDVDHFKKINDDHGHAFGDEILRVIARILHESVRGLDEAFRWGGDEFAVLASHTALESAKFVAERIQKNIIDHAVCNQAGITLSIGLGEFNPNESSKDFFNRIDHTLRQAKLGGRNRICTSSLSQNQS